VLWLAGVDDPLSQKSLQTLQRLGVPHEKLLGDELKNRYPQMSFDNGTWAIYEPQSGALMARRAVQTLVEETVRLGGTYAPAGVTAPDGRGQLRRLTTSGGTDVVAEQFVFACGPWLPVLFPALLEGRIRPTRQEVFFFGPPFGDRSFAPPQLPVWVDFSREFYGLPDLENRGFKIASDHHGPLFDPDTGSRVVSESSLVAAREFIAVRFPALANAPLVETRVCQYENTSSGDFLIDRHPDFDNVWLLGGGSGHGFKHGPAVAEYLAQRVTGEETDVDARFSLTSKDKVQQRTIY
jgi:glycine/D-amino acid oxidase-like deaminating enzyme